MMTNSVTNTSTSSAGVEPRRSWPDHRGTCRAASIRSSTASAVGALPEQVRLAGAVVVAGAGDEQAEVGGEGVAAVRAVGAGGRGGRPPRPARPGVGQLAATAASGTTCPRRGAAGCASTGTPPAARHAARRRRPCPGRGRARSRAPREPRIVLERGATGRRRQPGGDEGVGDVRAAHGRALAGLRRDVIPGDRVVTGDAVDHVPGTLVPRAAGPVHLRGQLRRRRGHGGSRAGAPTIPRDWLESSAPAHERDAGGRRRRPRPPAQPATVSWSVSATHVDAPPPRRRA